MKPMLAATIPDGASLTYPLIISQKLDGVRCLVKDGVVLSRNLKPIPNKYVQKLFKHAEGVDGELIIGAPYGEGVFNTTSSGVMSVEGKPDVRLFVFDNYTSPLLPYEERMAEVVKYESSRIIMLAYQTVKNRTSLLRIEKKYLELGYEGAMLRNPKAPYKYGRSTLKEGALMKLKQFEDSEAEVLELSPLMTNTNVAKRDALGALRRNNMKAGMVPQDTLGRMLVKDLKTGVEFHIGSGFTAAQRKAIWDTRPIGSIVKYKYQARGVKDKPRFPVFLGFRDPIDL